MEEIFEIPEIEDIDMYPYHSIIETIVDRNFGNTYQNQNEPNQRQPTPKNTSQQYQYRNSRQQYQNINTSQQYQHRNPSRKINLDPFKYQG